LEVLTSIAASDRGSLVRRLRSRRLAWLDAAIAALALFAAVLLLVAWFDNPAIGASFLLIVPVAVVSRTYGFVPGLAAAAVGVAAVVVAELLGAGFTVAGCVMRALVLLCVPLLIAWIQRGQGHMPTQTWSDPTNGTRRLTPRELDVLRLLVLGHTNAEIAEQLVLSVRTIESHRARIRRKLRRKTRSELVQYALEHKLVEQPSNARA
jgi:DNA-binding CsgD family transcriptional regulator